MEKQIMPSVAKSRAGRAGALALVTALATLPLGSACGRVQADNASSYLIVDSLQGIAGGSTTPSVELGSDVRADATGIRWEDGGQVKFELALKNPTITAPTTNNFITLTGYHVSYARSDGTTGPVPAAFDGTITVTVSDQTTTGFTLVQSSAKFATPLTELVGTLNEIDTVATVTFFGKDQNGRAVQVTAKITVKFADWVG